MNIAIERIAPACPICTRSLPQSHPERREHPCAPQSVECACGWSGWAAFYRPQHDTLMYVAGIELQTPKAG